MSDPELYKDIGESMGTVFGIFVNLLKRVDALEKRVAELAIPAEPPGGQQEQGHG